MRARISDAHFSFVTEHTCRPIPLFHFPDESDLYFGGESCALPPPPLMHPADPRASIQFSRHCEDTQMNGQWIPKKWENDGTFHLGINMAGAVSAGAYTAGVLDFL